MNRQQSACSMIALCSMSFFSRLRLLDRYLSKIMMAWYADFYMSKRSVSDTSANQSMIKFRTS